jgi:transposase
MWKPPMAWSAAEPPRAARTRKARTFFVLLRECRHERLDADFQPTLTNSESPGSGGHEPVEAGLLALATLGQAYGHVGDRDAVELTVLDKRWQLVRECRGAAQPPFSQGTLGHCRMRRIAHNLDKTLLDRPVALAEHPGGFGARPRRAVLDSPPRFGVSRGEDTLHLLGQALRQAQGAGACAGPGPGGGRTLATLAGATPPPGHPGPSDQRGHGDHRPEDHPGYGPGREARGQAHPAARCP